MALSIYAMYLFGKADIMKKNKHKRFLYYIVQLH
jgi:hypothetical protein